MTPEDIIQGVQKAVAITTGVLNYKLELINSIIKSEELDPDYKRIYQLLESKILNFLIPCREELKYLDIMWAQLGKASKLNRYDYLVLPTPIAFTGEISSAGKNLEDFTYQDRSLEGLKDPNRFEKFHNALSSDMTVLTCSAFWFDNQMKEWWAGLQDFEKTPKQEFYNLRRRAVQGGRRQLFIGRACFPDSAGYYWRIQGRGMPSESGRTAADFDEIYNYYQEVDEKPMICYDGCFILDTTQLSAGDAALRELSPFDIAETDPG